MVKSALPQSNLQIINYKTIKTRFTLIRETK